MIPTAAVVTEHLPRLLRRHKLILAWMKMTGEDPVQLVRIREDAQAYVDLRDGFLRLIPIEGEFEPDFFRIADRLLADGGSFLDVGANHGLFSFGLAHRHPEVDFRLFEPNASLVERMQKTLALYPRMNCSVVQSAVSDTSGELTFNIVEHQTGVSRIDPDGSTTVKSITLDDYLCDHPGAGVPLMKIDVEGYELRAMRGAKRSLIERRIGAVYFEHFEKNVAGICDPQEVIDFLASVGFVAHFCRAEDLERTPATHTISSGLPGHGLPLAPVHGQKMPPATDLLALPGEHIAKTTK